MACDGRWAMSAACAGLILLGFTFTQSIIHGRMVDAISILIGYIVAFAVLFFVFKTNGKQA